MSRLLTISLVVLGLAACQSPHAPQAKQAGAGAAGDTKAPVARLNGETITSGELDEVVRKDLRRMETDYQERVYEIRKAGLDSLITKRLVDDKAKAAGIAAEAFVKREVLDKVGEPSDDEVRALYERAKTGGRPLPPLDQVKGDIAKYIKEQKQQEALRAYYDKLRSDSKVEILLPPYRPPRIDVAAVGPSKGNPSAPVTIVEFSDYQCPYCSKAESTVAQVLAEYKDKVRLVYRDFPLPFHDRAQKAAEAALCAQEQGKYWEMHDKLFANQQALEPASLKGYARDIGLDVPRFDRCLDSGEKAKLVESSRRAGDEAGVSGTPAFFVNGMMLSGAQPYESFKTLIDSELTLKKQ